MQAICLETYNWRREWPSSFIKMQECASRNEDFQFGTILYFQATSLTYKLVFFEQRHFCFFTLLSLLKILFYLEVGRVKFT